MKLNDIMKCLKADSIEGPLDVQVRGVVSDSRRVQPGMIFVAVRGSCHDGRDHAGEAVARGAVAVVADAPVVVTSRVAKIVVKDARIAKASLAATYNGNPSEKMLVIGVAGSAGTAPVAWIIKHMLEAAGIQSGLVSSIQHSAGDRVFPSRPGSPGADDLQDLLARMFRHGCRACVIEISPQALEQKRVWGVAFDIIVHTRFRNGMSEVPEFPAAFQEFWESLQQGSKKTCAVVNIDDSAGRDFLEHGRASLRVAYGTSAQADVQAEEISCDAEGLSMRIKTPGATWFCETPLLGKGSVYHVLGAVGAGIALRLTPHAMRRGVEKAGRVPGRMESLEAGQSFAVVIDDAHDPAGLRDALVSLGSVAAGRVLLVFGSGGGRSCNERRLLGEIAARHSHFAWISNDNPRREAPSVIASHLEAGFKSVRNEGVVVRLNRQMAITEAIEMALPGDLVLIAGKGNETFQEFEDTVVPFDDRLYARQALENLGYGNGKKVTRCGLQSMANIAHKSRSLQPATSNPLAWP